MPRVALIKPPATYADWFKRPVLGLSCISAYLEQNGFDCMIFDAVFQGWSEKELVQQVETYRPDMVGVTAMTHEITRAAHIVAIGLMVPYPGTEVYEMAKRGAGGYRLLSEDWSEYDKYGGKSLALKDLSYEELLKYQRWAYIRLYLENFRLLDLFGFVWKRKRSLWYFISKKLRSRLTGRRGALTAVVG